MARVYNYCLEMWFLFDTETEKCEILDKAYEIPSACKRRYKEENIWFDEKGNRISEDEVSELIGGVEKWN